ncbi:SEC-C domain-containing protein [Alicyclobacillus tolerans]|uniref:SEC-C metal-binding domain-containing protein n=1 Tax=Alicyclobacillus tolerans TaxID=90970 RepID=UPI001F403B49|nr:SEC-C metal-binding domain-containing protein [Alicyclobacillus tolerans]MCF8567891.1 SEC-C domain-containing protein [Alicyclobacillus tolerans]
MLRLLMNPPAGYEGFSDIHTKITRNYTVNLHRSRYEVIESMLLEQQSICTSLKQLSREQGNEQIANACSVVGAYISFLLNYSRYWTRLHAQQYRASWDKLQDTIDDLSFILRFTGEEIQSHFQLQLFREHLSKLEALYPFTVFASSEFLNLKETCSICGRSPFEKECTHLPGELYWGEVAHTIVEKCELLSVAMVRNPMDKRCVVQATEKQTRGEAEQFPMVHYFAKHLRPLYKFEVEETTETKPVSFFKDVGVNEQCPCGSGEKYKKCCKLKGFVTRPHVIFRSKGVFNITCQDRLVLGEQ